MSDTAAPDSASDSTSDQEDPGDVIDAEVVPDPSPIEPTVPQPLTPDAGYTAGGVPTFESVREKIETRYGTSVGSRELASETDEGRRVDEQYEARQRAAHERLEQIRASMRDESGSAADQT